MILKCIDINKIYGSFNALEDINLEFEKGTIVGLLGPNGSGKTTLLKILNGLTSYLTGSILFEDKEISYEDNKDIAYLPDNDFLNKNMNANEISNFYSDFFEDFSKETFKKILDDFNIPFDKNLKNLSHGMLKKLEIALTISRKSKIYFLDEPLGGIDLSARKKVIDAIIENYNEEALLIISTHLIAEVENILDRVIFLKNGRVILDKSCDEIREEENKSIANLFLEVYND